MACMSSLLAVPSAHACDGADRLHFCKLSSVAGAGWLAVATHRPVGLEMAEEPCKEVTVKRCHGQVLPAEPPSGPRVNKHRAEGE